ncbi:hypothetical protein E9973_13090 [Salmonella enterica]|nr:hypothetical protein [Salmonella enterica subsp. enterica serovar Javiana]EAY4678747.1 hypothetical protein [Salmonella enterica]EBL5124693.1 hypothetical protein [Salmonella enterica subsp. enterica serovar Rubislaw]EDA0233654.1 hypothetical protein [Salmonella enterica]EEK4999073.1 hypothetical protein [Salmonella enterica]
MKDISTALRTRMQEAAASLNLPVAWPLEAFTPPDGDWLEFIFCPASDAPLSQGPGGLNTVAGFIRITVHCKQREGVSSDALFYGDRLRAFFTTGTTLTCNGTRVTLRNRDYNGPLPVAGHVVWILTVYWSSYELRS